MTIFPQRILAGLFVWSVCVILRIKSKVTDKIIIKKKVLCHWTIPSVLWGNLNSDIYQQDILLCLLSWKWALRYISNLQHCSIPWKCIAFSLDLLYIISHKIKCDLLFFSGWISTGRGSPTPLWQVSSLLDTISMLASVGLQWNRMLCRLPVSS